MGGGNAAYNLRKMAPRILIAFIGVQLSFFLSSLMIDIFNGLGSGVANLFYQIADANNIPIVDTTAIQGGQLGQGAAILGLGTAAAAGILTTAAAGGGIIPAMVGFGVMALIVVIVAGLTLVLRQILIIGLVIVSPLAFVAYLIPNLEQYFKKWWSSYLKLLMMYPLIVGLFGVGKIAGQIASITAANAQGTPGNGGIASSPTMILMAFLANVIPLGLVPYTLKFGGGIMAAGGNIGRQLGSKTGKTLRDPNSRFLRSSKDNAAKKGQLKRDRRVQGQQSEDATNYGLGRALKKLPGKGGIANAYAGAHKAVTGKEGLLSNFRSATAKQARHERLEAGNDEAIKRRDEAAAAAYRPEKAVGAGIFAQTGGDHDLIKKKRNELEAAVEAGEQDQVVLDGLNEMAQYEGNDEAVFAAARFAMQHDKAGSNMTERGEFLNNVIQNVDTSTEGGKARAAAFVASTAGIGHPYSKDIGMTFDGEGPDAKPVINFGSKAGKGYNAEQGFAYAMSKHQSYNLSNLNDGQVTELLDHNVRLATDSSYATMESLRTGKSVKAVQGNAEKNIRDMYSYNAQSRAGLALEEARVGDGPHATYIDSIVNPPDKEKTAPTDPREAAKAHELEQQELQRRKDEADKA